MKSIKPGDYVRVHYTGRLDNGEIFDSSRGCRPMEVRIGANEVISGFEKALIGMTESEKKSFSVGPDEAYGYRDANLEKHFQRSDFPLELQPEVGQVIVLQSSDQGQFPATVKEIAVNEILLDLNHPLAGRALNFEVEVVSISDEPTPPSCTCAYTCA